METLFGRFEFLNFEPSNELKTSAKGILSAIINESPSDAISKAIIERTHKGFEGALRITSLAGTFLVQAIETDPLKAVHKLQEKIVDQLANWKMNRASLLLAPAEALA